MAFGPHRIFDKEVSGAQFYLICAPCNNEGVMLQRMAEWKKLVLTGIPNFPLKNYTSCYMFHLPVVHGRFYCALIF